MRVYLKNGQKIRITQEEAILIIKAVDKADENQIFYLTFKKERYAMFKIAEIAAVK